MPDSVENKLLHALDLFFRERAAYHRYTCNGDPPMLTAAEIVLLEAIERCASLLADDVSLVRSRFLGSETRSINIRRAYLLTFFAVRMAVYGVRSQNAQVVELGLLGLVLDDNLVDYREVLKALVIIEDCAKRLGLDLGTILGRYLHLASAKRRETIEEYLSRTPEWRGLRIMGIIAKGSDANLTYDSVPWE